MILSHAPMPIRVQKDIFAMLLMNPLECQGLLLTSRDLVFGIIYFGLYYALLTWLYIPRVGAE